MLQLFASDGVVDSSVACRARSASVGDVVVADLIAVVDVIVASVGGVVGGVACVVVAVFTAHVVVVVVVVVVVACGWG
jgi:hypothetical protein